MTNLILVHPDDDLNLTKTIVEIDNWRVIGRMPGGKFYLITPDCKVYHINNFTLKQFNSMITAGLDLVRQGMLDTIALICPKCGGSGITDWITDVVGVKVQHGTFDIDFKRDPNVPVYKSRMYANGKPFTVYFSRAIIPKAHQHCTECKGTGLFIIDVLEKDLGEKITEYNFR